VGIHQRANDLKVNICRLKQLTNMRSAGADEKTNLTPPMLFSLEEAVEYIEDTEFVEVTPAAIRMGKAGKK
jgi:GTP-binding protein